MRITIRAEMPGKVHIEKTVVVQTSANMIGTLTLTEAIDLRRRLDAAIEAIQRYAHAAAVRGNNIP